MFNRIRVGRGSVYVPVGIRRVPSGVWTHSACRPAAVALSNLTGHVSRLWLGPLRSGKADWSPPIDSDDWDQWLARASSVVGAAVSDMIIIPPASPHRRRFAMLLLDRERRQVGFAKWGLNPLNPLGLAAEERLSKRTLDSFVVPRLLDHGTIDGWSYTINETLPPGAHRPATLSPDRRRILVDEIHQVLAGLEDSTVVHGDFAPWNVRELGSGDIAVIDWEQVVAAPVATDEVWFVVTETLSTGGSTGLAESRVRAEVGYRGRSAVEDAARFLRGRAERQPPEADDSVTRSASLLDFEARISEVLSRLGG